MIYLIEYLSTALKQARKRKGLSQRALSTRVGTPQAQISKIENAAVDLKTTSLIELARALDLEVMLVPRQQVPTVTRLIQYAPSADQATPVPRPAYSLDEESDDG